MILKFCLDSCCYCHMGHFNQHLVHYLTQPLHSVPLVHSRAQSARFSSSHIMTAPGQIGWMDVQIYGHGLDHYELLHIWVKSCRTGKKCSKCHKTALTKRVVLAKRLVLATCPFGFLEITMSWCSGMIFIFLECQETCAGNIEIPGNSRKSIF